jgi:hypothetical protein
VSAIGNGPYGDRLPTAEELARWRLWAQERAAVELAHRRAPDPGRPLVKAGRSVPRDADWHARAIRRAIGDAEKDGMVVDFGWDGFSDQMKWYLAVGDSAGNWTRDAVRIWPLP